jgi:hypothetical protein
MDIGIQVKQSNLVGEIILEGAGPPGGLFCNDIGVTLQGARAPTPFLLADNAFIGFTDTGKDMKYVFPRPAFSNHRHPGAE